jgi:imidazoleglycerol-phosphate dehydratase
MIRQACVNRKTKETNISITLNIDGEGKTSIQCPIPFFNHMLDSFAKHGLFDLEVSARGDIQVDQHHLLEDCGTVLGESFEKALGDKRGINRAGYFVYPMDDALSVVAVDLGGRPFLQYDLSFSRQFCGDLNTDLMFDFFQAFSIYSRSNLVVRLPHGRSDHHKLEAVFKAWGKAMKMACSMDSRGRENIPSTKGRI